MNGTTIQLSPGAQKVIADLKDKDQILTAVANGMDYANQLVVGHIMRARLTGQGPFPVEQHKLGERTHRLKGALWASKARHSNGVVTSGIGDNVKYAAIHEFGGRINHPPRSGTVRLRTDAAGELMRQMGFPHLARFAKASHKRARKVQFHSTGHIVNMPERAPIRTGIQEKLPEYGRIVSDAIVDSLSQS